MSFSLRRAFAPLVAAVAIGSTAGTALTIVAPSTAYADSSYSMEAQFIANVNAARQANGQAPYSVASDLTAIARQQSATMASRQSLYHNPGLTSQVSNWQAVGENVGEGPSVGDVHTAFMNSPEHRANILDHDFTQIGVGVSIDKNGIVWVTEDFREPMGGASTSSPSSSAGSSHPVSTTSHYSPSTSAAPVVAQPTPTMSPRAVLLQKLHELRQHGRHSHTRKDPVAQSFDYVANLSRLAS